VRADERIVVWTKWVPYGDDRPMRLEWRTPKGKRGKHEWTLHGGNVLTQIDMKSKTAMSPGVWWVSIWQGDTMLISGSFRVVD
jgi:hypothetical protein